MGMRGLNFPSVESFYRRGMLGKCADLRWPAADENTEPDLAEIEKTLSRWFGNPLG
jgi:hypothetical protein